MVDMSILSMFSIHKKTRMGGYLGKAITGICVATKKNSADFLATEKLLAGCENYKDRFQRKFEKFTLTAVQTSTHRTTLLT